MIKIAISGQANTGKNTLGEILITELSLKKGKTLSHQLLAFATPIKKIAEEMFPLLPKEYLYGPSYLRNKIIPNAFKNGESLTVRQLLLDIGTKGREYNEDIWVNNFAKSFTWDELIIVSDVRFLNEYYYLADQRFFQIRLYRQTGQPIIDHVSETKQSEIKDECFDYVLHNDRGLEELRQEVITNILPLIKNG
jgi:hypothetical protein